MAGKKKKLDPTKPQVLVHDFIRFHRNGPLQVTVTMIGVSPFNPDRTERREETVTVPQPSPWGDSDDPVLAAVKKHFPAAHVAWLNDAEPQV